RTSALRIAKAHGAALRFQDRDPILGALRNRYGADGNRVPRVGHKLVPAALTLTQQRSGVAVTVGVDADTHSARIRARVQVYGNGSHRPTSHGCSLERFSHAHDVRIGLISDRLKRTAI